jgi:hypothetical protein
VQEILVDRRQLVLQHGVQMLQYFGIAFHARHSDGLLFSARSWRMTAGRATHGAITGKFPQELRF